MPRVMLDILAKNVRIVLTVPSACLVERDPHLGIGFGDETLVGLVGFEQQVHGTGTV